MAQSLIFESNMIDEFNSDDIFYEMRFVENLLKIINHLLDYIKLSKNEPVKQIQKSTFLINEFLGLIKNKINSYENLEIENIDKKELDKIKRKINKYCGKDAIDEFNYIYKKLKFKDEQ